MNDYTAAFGFNNMQPEVMTAKASKKLGLVLFAAAAAGATFVATRPRVQRALRELMTPEPQDVTVAVAAE